MWLCIVYIIQLHHLLQNHALVVELYSIWDYNTWNSIVPGSQEVVSNKSWWSDRYHRENMPLWIYMVCGASWPQWHLPPWREENEQAFVHCGKWKSKKGLDNIANGPALHVPSTCNKVTNDRFQALWKTKSFDKVCLKFQLPLCTKACSSYSLHSGKCHRGTEYHTLLLSWVA